MKIIEGFKMRDIAGQKVVVGEGLKQIDFNRIIALNSTAAYLWSNVEGKEFDVQMLVGLLTDKYDIDKNIATDDVMEMLSLWQKEGLVEE